AGDIAGAEGVTAAECLGGRPVDFHLRCACGQDVPVPASAAGASVDCRCGQKLAVPSLGELRRQAGLNAYQASAALVIEHMRADGELPTSPDCAVCGQATTNQLVAVADCEKAWGGRSDQGDWDIAYQLFGLWSLVFRELQPREERGRTLIVQLPIRVCPDCRDAI